MSENRKVAPWWAHGYLCPHCGRPLRWLGEWHGPRFVRKPYRTELRHRISPSDEVKRVVTGQQGLEATTEVRYIHEVSLECIPCCALYSEDHAKRGYLPDDEYPSSYFVAGDQPSLGSANGVQTPGPNRGDATA